MIRDGHTALAIAARLGGDRPWHSVWHGKLEESLGIIGETLGEEDLWSTIRELARLVRKRKRQVIAATGRRNERGGQIPAP